ncbi:MAG: PEP-CTERM sorting domain-containing protein [Deltaproteobacteria bacterium]|nr:PEP-CTERM sorting domain-containing protein [Deltaproteobacteria bacterium]
MRIQKYFVVAIVLLLSGSAQAAPITATWSGSASIPTASAAPIPATFVITFQADTSSRITVNSEVFVLDPATSGTILLNGVLRTFTAPGLRFGVNQGADVIFLGQGADGDDILDIGCNPSCASWDLTTSFGPVFEPSPFGTGSFHDIPTDMGPLTLLDISDVTFAATVPEPTILAIFGSGIAGLAVAGRRRS